MNSRQPLTPAMLRTRYHELTAVQPGNADPSERPQLATDGDGAQSDAADEWLAHIGAGRISIPSAVEGEAK